MRRWMPKMARHLGACHVWIVTCPNGSAESYANPSVSALTTCSLSLRPRAKGDVGGLCTRWQLSSAWQTTGTSALWCWIWADVPAKGQNERERPRFGGFWVRSLFSSVPLGLHGLAPEQFGPDGAAGPDPLQTVVVVVLDARRVQSCAKVPQLTVRADSPDGGATTVV